MAWIKYPKKDMVETFSYFLCKEATHHYPLYTKNVLHNPDHNHNQEGDVDTDDSDDFPEGRRKERWLQLLQKPLL